jgi:hypothetical protein
VVNIGGGSLILPSVPGPLVVVRNVTGGERVIGGNKVDPAGVKVPASLRLTDLTQTIRLLWLRQLLADAVAVARSMLLNVDVKVIVMSLVRARA